MADEKTKDGNGLPKGWPIFLFGVLVWIGVGSLMAPGWWYDFLFQGEFLEASAWGFGFNSIISYIFNSPVMLIFIIVAFFSGGYYIAKPERKLIFLRKGTEFIASTFFRVSLILLLIMAGLRLFGVGQFRAQVTAMTRELAETARPQKPTKNPLDVPTTFLYVDTIEIENLYGQTEPELIPSRMVSELASSDEIKGGITLEQFIKTELGRSRLEKNIAEYTATVKTPQRKLKELLRYLTESDKLPELGPYKSSSEDVQELESAIALLRDDYSIEIQEAAVTRARDRLFEEDLILYAQYLGGLDGLLIVGGDWTVRVDGQSLRATRILVPGVSNSPRCEFKLSGAELTPRFRDLAEHQRGVAIRLTIFGKLVTGFTNPPAPAIIQPIAVF